MDENTPEPFTFNDDGSFNLPDGTKVASAKELGEGWMRQADYTRKTQDLALQRKDLDTAAQLYEQLKINPSGTLKSLAANMGVDLGTPPPASAPAPRHSDDDWDSDWDQPASAGQGEDPRITELYKAIELLSDQVTSLSADSTRSKITSEMQQVKDSLAEQWNIEVDEGELLRYATANGINNLEVAANSLYMGDIIERTRENPTGPRDESSVVEAKREASRAVRPGVGSAGEATVTDGGDTGSKMSLRDALAASFKEHGVQDFKEVSFDESPTSVY